MMLLKAITVRNLMSSNINILITGPNFKITCVMVAMIWRCCALIITILLLSLQDIDCRCIIHDISNICICRYV